MTRTRSPVEITCEIVNRVCTGRRSRLARTGSSNTRRRCRNALQPWRTGVPIVSKMSPPVADLESDRVQAYSDGQLKWIIDNGVRFSGMPAWKGILDDGEMWHIVRYIRHLPTKGSLGVPAVFKES